MDAVHRLIRTLCDDPPADSAAVAERAEACVGAPRDRTSPPDWGQLAGPVITSLEMLAVWEGDDSAVDMVRCVQAVTVFAGRHTPLPPKVAAALKTATVALCRHVLSLPHATAAQLASLAYNCGKQRLRDGALMSALLAELTQPHRKAALTPKDLANALWGAAKSGSPIQPTVLQQLTRHLCRPDVLRSLAPRAAANILWACARLQLRDPALLAAFVSHLRQPDRVRECNAQDMASILWALASMGVDSPALHEAFADRIIEEDLLGQFTPQGIANLLWSFATLNVRNDVLFALVADHLVAQQVIRAFNSQDVANTLWSFATLQIYSERLLAALGKAAAQLLPRMTPQHISNVLLSFARLNFADPPLLTAVADHVLANRVVEAMTPQELANTVWAYAALRVPEPRLMAAVAELCRQTSTLSTLNWQELSNVLWSFAVLQLSDDRFLLACTNCIMRQSSDLKAAAPLSVSLLSWAFATLGAEGSPVLIEVANLVAQDGALRSYSPQNVANVAWALAAGNVVHDDALAALLRAAARSPSAPAPGSTNARFVGSLHQLVLHVRQHRAALPQSSRLLGDFAPLCAAWQAAFEAQSRQTRSSAFQAEVAQCLTVLQVPYEMELVLPEAGSYSVDFLLTDCNVVLEVDGPQHFLRVSDQWRPTGATQLKRRLLRHAGYRPLSVPFYDWEMQQTPERRCRYLQELLSHVEPVPPVASPPTTAPTEPPSTPAVGTATHDHLPPAHTATGGHASPSAAALPLH